MENLFTKDIENMPKARRLKTAQPAMLVVKCVQ